MHKVQGKVRVGVAGFAYKDWAGIVYPAGLDPKRRVEYLARYLPLIEINTSFYGHIKPAAGKQWCRQAAGVNPQFVFTAKLNRAFTHSPLAVVEPTSAATIRPGPNDERDAKAGFNAIAEETMLGAVLAQFPASFKNTEENRGYVERLARRFGEYPLVLEVRHAGWNEPQVLGWLGALGVGLCNIDQPLLGRALKPAAHATSAIGYVRLHGRNYQQWFGETNVRDRYDYLYTEKELQGWKQRTEEIAAHTEQTFVVANNHNVGKAAANALELTALLEERKVEVPDTLAAQYPELLVIAAG